MEDTLAVAAPAHSVPAPPSLFREQSTLSANHHVHEGLLRISEMLIPFEGPPHLSTKKACALAQPPAQEPLLVQMEPGEAP